MDAIARVNGKIKRMEMRDQIASVTSDHESIWSRARSVLRGVFGSALEFFHAPAKIREFEYVDTLTNETVYLSTGARYSVLHVGDKQFFFSRLTGRFDGTCTSLKERIADGLELLD